MAIVQGPLHSDLASGTIGSITFANSSYGTIARVRNLRVDQHSQRQTELRRFVFENETYEYMNRDITTLDRWDDFASRNYFTNCFGQKLKLNGRFWHGLYAFRARYYGTYFDYWYPPPSSQCNFWPDSYCVWEGGLIKIYCDGDLPLYRHLIVMQKRNLKTSALKPQKGRVCYIFHGPQSSPLICSGTLTVPDEPPGWPALIGNQWTHVHWFFLDGYSRATPTLNTKIRTV